ncbi:MAG: hypothetical protein KGV56_02715 [Gammaproteobacteria bacterium]|nr:hypothetical protein [Gammaproteobacteria bacterium]
MSITKNIIKNIALVSLLSYATVGQAETYNQQEKDISKIVKELTYLIQVSKQLQHKYRGDKSKIKFNYPALIQQLKATRLATQEYLNQELYEIHKAPPVIHKPQLTKVK